MRRDSALRTITTAFILCLACSVVVAAAANALKGTIDENEELKRQRNVLVAAGLFDPQTDDESIVPKLYEERVASVIVELEGGEISETLNVADYDPAKAAESPDTSTSTDGNLMGIDRRENAAFAYLVRREDDPNAIGQLVLPVYGKGLWSTLMGYVALKSDMETIAGLTFYKHAETPGLGGEIDNPRWKASWKGKVAYGPDGEPAVRIVKGGYDRNSPSADYSIDGLSGATITSNGVESLVNYWLSDAGFGPFIDRVRNGEVSIPGPGESPDPAEHNDAAADPEELREGEGAGIGTEGT